MFVFFLCYSLTRHKNPLEIFPYGDPPVPTGKLGKLTPLSHGKSDPFRGEGYGYFLEPHKPNLILFFLWAMHFRKRTLKTELLQSIVLNCYVKVKTADFRKIGLKMREWRFRELKLW